MKEFKPRLIKPEKGNPYYTTQACGGYSEAPKGNPVNFNCDTLSSNTAYAYGRFNEIGGWDKCKYLYPTSADNFIHYAGGCNIGDTPKIGACMVWKSNVDDLNRPGHVAIVEKIINDNEIITSESECGILKPFHIKKRKNNDLNNWGEENYTFLGFIYNPAECCQEIAELDDSPLYKVDTLINFKGVYCYKNSMSKYGKKCAPGAAKVMAISHQGLHSYYITSVQGSKSDVCGWVDEKDIEPYSVEEGPVSDYPLDVVEDILGYYQIKPLFGLSLRAGPNKSKKIIEIMPHNSVVYCSGGRTQDWYYIISNKGNIGFCQKKYLSKL